MEIQAAVLGGVGQPQRVRTVALEPPKAGEVLVKIAATGLCASDVNAIDGKRTLVPFPAVLGHEAAGVVAEVGPGVTSLGVGDHVVLSIVPSCGTCSWCSQGVTNFCSTAGNAMGDGTLFDGTRRLSLDGQPLHHFLTVSSFAEYAVVPASGVVRIPEQMPLDRAALLSCAVLTGFGSVVNTAKVRPGSSVAVFGCGGVGLNIVQGARIAGADRIVAVDVTAEKLQIARSLGATDVIDASVDDPVTAIKDLIGGVDYAFEALGREATIQQAWRTVAPRGELVLVGLMAHGATLTVDAGPFVNEQAIKGCYFGSSDLTKDVPRLVELYLAGDLKLDELIGQRIGLADLDSAVDALRRGEGVRSVITFD